MKLLLLFISLSCFSQKNMVKIEGFNGQQIINKLRIWIGDVVPNDFTNEYNNGNRITL